MKVKDVMTTSVKTIEPTGRAVGQGVGGAMGSIRDVGASDVVYCFEDQDVEEATTLMQEHQIRRVVVLNRAKKIVGIVSLGEVALETADEKPGGETLEQDSKPSPSKTAQRPTTSAQPEAEHVQSVDPEAQVAELAQPPYDAQLEAEGKDQPKNEQHRLQKVLPKVKALAQKVGGFNQLAEMAKSLDQHAQPQATGKDQPKIGQHRLQEVLPEVTDLAQRVGGFNQLAELAMTLDQSKE